MGKVLKWMISNGGLDEFERRATERAALFHDTAAGVYRIDI